MMRCPSCNALVVYNTGDGRLKIRTKMLALTKSGAEVVCKKCGADVPLDLSLGAELKKALNLKPTRLVLRKSVTQLDTEKPIA